MRVGQLSESDAVDTLRLPFYSPSHHRASHCWGNLFYLGNTGLSEGFRWYTFQPPSSAVSATLVGHYCSGVYTAHGYQPHIRRIGEETLDNLGEKSNPARRWVVERTLSWLSRCRGLLVRYDKRASNFLGLLQLACALLWYRRQWRLLF